MRPVAADDDAAAAAAAEIPSAVVGDVRSANFKAASRIAQLNSSRYRQWME